MIDELFDVGFKIARQVVVFQQDAVLERLMPAFDLALGLRMKRSAVLDQPDMAALLKRNILWKARTGSRYHTATAPAERR